MADGAKARCYPQKKPPKLLKATVLKEAVVRRVVISLPLLLASVHRNGILLLMVLNFSMQSRLSIESTVKAKIFLKYIE